jgi:hypothetical protein
MDIFLAELFIMNPPPISYLIVYTTITALSSQDEENRRRNLPTTCNTQVSDYRAK